jgi:hypothetical protein
VRPYCPPRSCDGAKPWEQSNYWFWDSAANQIGHNQADRDKFRQFVNQNKGRTWIIGNEPDSNTQDNLTPTQYAQMYHAYYSQIRSIDPTAKFALTSVTGVVHHREFPYIQNYLNAIFDEYQRLYNTPIVFDYWNLHAYYHGWLPTHPRTNPEMTNLVFARIINPFLDYRQTAQSGRYRQQPVLITELGIAAKQLNLTSDQVIQYMKLTTNQVLPLVKNKSVESFFWFYGGWSTGDYTISSLLQSDWKTPTPLGKAYATEAQKWSVLFEPSLPPTKAPTPTPTPSRIPTPTPTLHKSDYDHDGDVDYKDMAILKTSLRWRIFDFSLLMQTYRR